MIRLIISTVLALIVLIGPAQAQPGAITLSSSSYRYWCCNAEDRQEGLLKIYVYHVYTPGATASQFMVLPSTGVNLIYITETSPFGMIIGNSQNGIAIAYEACLQAPILLLEIVYYTRGLSQSCSVMNIVPNFNAPSGQIEVADCSDPPNILVATGGELIVNMDESCMWWECYCDPDPVEQTSWGAIKSLYRGQ